VPQVSPSPSSLDVASIKVKAEGADVQETSSAADLTSALLSLKTLVLSINMILGLGAGLMVINNLESLCAARIDGDPAVFISLFSTFNSFGRILAGLGSDVVVYQFGRPRTLVLAAVDLLLAATMATMYLDGVWPLYVLVIVGGLSYGAINMVRLTSTAP
jgi:MFS family permease